MAGSPNLSQSFLSGKSDVRVLSGYGIRVHVEHGHLVLEDKGLAGTGTARLARVAHGLKRLVVIGSDGFVTLAALRWLADQEASLVMLSVMAGCLRLSVPRTPPMHTCGGRRH